jgi:hypothetical protein
MKALRLPSRLAFRAWTLAFCALASLTASPLLAQRPESSSKAATASPDGSRGNPGTGSADQALYWHDASQRRPLIIDESRVADFGPDTGRAWRNPLRSRNEREKATGVLTTGVSPVLIDPGSPGSLRSLPGGVIVVLGQAPDGPDIESRQARAREQLLAAGLVPLRPIDPQARTWLVASETGLASLELANRLHESGEFESAAPNWWQQRALK